MMCTTVLRGGVCHRTSTPHKSGNKMKEKKKCTLAFCCGSDKTDKTQILFIDQICIVIVCVDLMLYSAF